MLTTLRIRNLALVADLVIELQPGFNAITGETGAGKSILIGALGLLLGERADRTLLRAGADQCTVEASLQLGRAAAAVDAFLRERGLETGEDGQLLLKRTFTASGANRQFINNSPASLQVLAELGERLVDIHGPHDHQSLFQPARQLELLDAYASLEADRAEFTREFDHVSSLLAARNALAADEQARLREINLLRHQVQEIEAARIDPESDAGIEEDYERASNAARLLELAHGALGLLSRDDDAIDQRAALVGRTLQELVRMDPSAEGLARLHEAFVESLRELQVALDGYADRLDLDPARLHELGERLDLLHSLRRKYGPSLEDVVAFGERARARLAQVENRDAERARIDAELEAACGRLAARGRALTVARRKAIPRLAAAVRSELRDLGFRQSEFDVELNTGSEPQRAGFDSVEFHFAPNPGEPARPLRAIASSGELARVMLAIKTVLAAEDQVPVLVFDEVDANVGGETAHAVGERMRRIGEGRQVLCITHLAPVAAAGNAHFVVSKQTRDGRTISLIEPVTGPARVAELARMLGGGQAAGRHAAALLEEGAPARSRRRRAGTAAAAGGGGRRQV